MSNSLIINSQTVINANTDYFGRSATLSGTLAVGNTSITGSTITVGTIIASSIVTSNGATGGGFAITGNGSFTGALSAGSISTIGTLSAGTTVFNGTVTLGSIFMQNGSIGLGNTAINTAGITVDYFTSRNSVSAQQIQATGSIGQVAMQDRANTAQNWITYASSGAYRVFLNGDKFTVDSSGNGSFGGNINGNNITASGWFSGQNNVQIGNGIATGFYADGSNVAVRTYGNNTIFFQTAGGAATMATFNTTGSQFNTNLTLSGINSLFLQGGTLQTDVSGNGGIRLVNGGANNSGYIEFRSANTAAPRLAYIGFGQSGGYLNFSSENALFNFVGNAPQINGYGIWHTGNFNPANYVTGGTLSNYATTSSLNNYATTSSLSNYATVASLNATNNNFGNYASLSQALRRDTGQSWYTYSRGAGPFTSANIGMQTSGGDFGAIRICDSGFGSDGNQVGGAFMSFHRFGYAVYFGLETDNSLRIGGWSMGNTSYRIWHEGNLNPGAYMPTSGGTFSGSIGTNQHVYAAGSVYPGNGIVSLNAGGDGSGSLYSRSGTLNMQNVYVNVLVQTSDERLKDIKPFMSNDEALGVINKLNPISYSWKKDSGIPGDTAELYGFSAQEVQKILPAIVQEANNDRLSLRYVDLIPVLTAAVKSLSAEVEELKARLS